MNKEVHVFDRALALEHSDTQSGLFTGVASADYWNMVGPFGGTTAALMLRAVLLHPDLLGAPIALTVNYASAIGPGPLEVLAIPVRTNRSTQHWRMEIRQPGEDGRMQANTTATAVTAARRETWSGHDLAMPDVPRPADTDRFAMGPKGVAWFDKYEMRPIRGAIPSRWEGAENPSETLLWMRDASPRAVDMCALAAMSDLFFPRVWLRRAKPVNAGTVSITIYFHAGEAELAEAGTGYLLGRARGQQFFNGFFDQAAQLWSEGGHLLATSQQIVYFKE